MSYHHHNYPHGSPQPSLAIHLYCQLLTRDLQRSILYRYTGVAYRF